jgi:hypothetical protein
MERKLFYADAFPHHETCSCKSCLAENEGRYENDNASDNKTRLNEASREQEQQSRKVA